MTIVKTYTVGYPGIKVYVRTCSGHSIKCWL